MDIELKMLFFFAVTSFIGWIMLFTGIGTRRDVQRRNDRERARTTGTIVDYVRKVRPMGRSTRVSWHPVVEFTADGERCRLEYDGYTDREQFPLGMELEILYDVSDPSHFHLEANPVYTNNGATAIRVAVIWILASAALTLILAVFVGGYRFDLNYTWHKIQRFFSRLRR